MSEGHVSRTPGAAINNGRYRLVREIAAGGMGRIWEGLDTQLDRSVAIKEVALDLVPPVARAEFVQRAIHEGRNAAALADHPNIVTVYDVVIEEDAPWTVMQFVRGRSLADVLRPGPLSVDATAAVAEQMLSALGFAHEAGIVHRDVKPLNIMIKDGDGLALLTDFGIAKSDRYGSLTQTGVVIGSTPYMAPERHEGESGSPSSDLFSLGVTLFEAIEGYSPFAKDSRTGTVTAILVKPLPAMRRAGRLEHLILALTGKDPRQRPTVMQALAMLKTAQGNLPPTQTAQQFRPPALPTGPQQWQTSEKGGVGEFSRPPWILPPEQQTGFKLPSPENDSRKRPFPVVMLIAPLVAAVLMAIIMRRPQYLMMAAMSPMMMLGNYVQNKK